MTTNLIKRPRRARWTLESEWESETLTITRSGEARLVQGNGGWGGAWDQKQYNRQQHRLLTMAEAAAILEMWDADEDDMQKIASLRPHLAADL